MRNAAKIAFWGGETPLPYDAEVEYLESDGSQHIDTGVYGDLQTSYEICFKPTAYTQRVFGSRTSAQADNCSTIVGATGVICDFGNYQSTRLNWDGVDMGSDIVVAYNSATLRRIENLTKGTNAESAASYASSFTTPLPLYIFSVSSPSFPYYTDLTGCVYYAKIWRDDTIIRDMIPVRVGTTGYMYDRVTKSLFGNAGTGAFVIGGDVT